MNRRVLMLLMSAAVMLTSGCAHLRFMNSQNKIPETCLATCAKLKIAPTKFILVAHISSQTLSLFEDAQWVKT